MVSHLISARSLIGVVGLLALLLAERVWPFRTSLDSRWGRYGINLFIAGSNAVVLSVLLSGMLLACYQHVERYHVGLLPRLGIGAWWNVALTVVFLDGVTYWWHRAYHRIPVMWRMHRVHHSDRDLDVTTSGRFHLTEMTLSALFRLAVIAGWGASVAAVLIFEIVFGIFNQLEHANLRLPDAIERWARLIVVTPGMHEIHHSQLVDETNSNYSTILSIWDRLFGTYRAAESRPQTSIGLPEYQLPESVTFGHVLGMPFGPPCGPGHAPTGALAPISVS